MNTPDERPTRPAPTDYRGGDIQVRILVYVIGGLALLVAFTWFANRMFFDFLEARALRLDGDPSPFADVALPRPSPMLQVNPVQDLDALRQQTDALLNTYEWVDPERRLVRIPVERAMEIIAEQGLPDFRAETEAAAGGSQ